MSLYYLLNSVQLAGLGNLSAGIVIDSEVKDIALIMAAGGQLWPITDAVVARGSAHAIAILKRGGSPTADGVMLAAAADSLRNSIAGAPASTFVVWRPGGVLETGVTTTWAGVEAAITASVGPFTVAIDTSIAPAVIPADTDFDCDGRVIFTQLQFGIGGNMMFATVEDGGQLSNIAGIKSSGLVGTPTIRPFLKMTAPGRALFLREAGQIVMGAGSTKSAISVEADLIEVAGYEGAKFDNNACPTIPVIDIFAGASIFILAFINLIGNADLPATLFAGGVGGTLNLVFMDSSINPLPAQTGFLGTTILQRYQHAGSMIPSKGNTASRPAGSAVEQGQMYFDTDLANPIWWGGSQWVDASGTPV